MCTRYLVQGTGPSPSTIVLVLTLLLALVPGSVPGGTEQRSTPALALVPVLVLVLEARLPSNAIKHSIATFTRIKYCRVTGVSGQSYTRKCWTASCISQSHLSRRGFIRVTAYQAVGSTPTLVTGATVTSTFAALRRYGAADGFARSIAKSNKGLLTLKASSSS